MCHRRTSISTTLPGQVSIASTDDKASIQNRLQMLRLMRSTVNIRPNRNNSIFSTKIKRVLRHLSGGSLCILTIQHKHYSAGGRKHTLKQHSPSTRISKNISRLASCLPRPPLALGSPMALGGRGEREAPSTGRANQRFSSSQVQRKTKMQNSQRRRNLSIGLDSRCCAGCALASILGQNETSAFQIRVNVVLRHLSGGSLCIQHKHYSAGGRKHTLKNTVDLCGF